MRRRRGATPPTLPDTTPSRGGSGTGRNALNGSARSGAQRVGPTDASRPIRTLACGIPELPVKEFTHRTANQIDAVVVTARVRARRRRLAGTEHGTRPSRPAVRIGQTGRGGDARGHCGQAGARASWPRRHQASPRRSSPSTCRAAEPPVELRNPAPAWAVAANRTRRPRPRCSSPPATDPSRYCAAEASCFAGGH